MNDVFLSYARQDLRVAKRIAEALAQENWSVWWDRRLLAGTTWREVVETALENSRCVIVLWSTHSVASQFVIEEAEVGRTRGVLCPVLIEAVKQPLGFRSFQAADLSDWKGDESAAPFRSLVEAVAQLTARGTSPADFATSRPRQVLEANVTKMFTGKWRIECDVPDGGAGWYDIEFRQDSELSGTGGLYLDRGPIGMWRSSMGWAGRKLSAKLSQPVAITGEWSYDEPNETLTLDFIASGFGQTHHEVLRIRLSSSSGDHPQGVDAAGRSYRLLRMQ